jgi:Chalcone isomerase-like
MKKILLSLFALSLFASVNVFALDVSGTNVPDKATVEGTELSLNGAGMRSKFMFKVYVASLYTTAKKTSAEDVLADAGAKRMQLNIRRELSAEQLLEALNEGLKANNTPAELAPLEARLKEFDGIMTSAGKAAPGNVIALDYIPGTGTRVQLNGQTKGTIAGDDFNKALLKIWLGPEAVQASLKKALLGN